MFRCKNGHESYKRQKGCTKCGEPLLEVAVNTPTAIDNVVPTIPVQDSNTSNPNENVAVDTLIIDNTPGIGVNNPLPNDPASPSRERPVTHSPKDPFEGVEVILEGIRQRNRNESNFRKLLETVTADDIVSMDEWKQIESLRPTVSEEFYDHWLSLYDVSPPEYSGQSDVACVLHWRTHGTLTANSKNLIEFKVSGLEQSSGQLTLTIADDDSFIWTSCFEAPTMLSHETTWKPRDHGWHLLVLTGSIETKTEMLVVSGQKIRIYIEPDTTKSGTVINTGAMVNHGVKVKKTSWSKWADLPLVIKKREPKLVNNPAPEPQPTNHTYAEPVTKPVATLVNPVEQDVDDSVITIIPANGLSPRPYTIRCPDGSVVLVYFGERLVLGRYSAKLTIDPMEYLGIGCYLPDGDIDAESTLCISKESLLIEQAGNMVVVAIHNRGRSLVQIDDLSVVAGQNVYLAVDQHSKITMGAPPGYPKGQKPAELTCRVVTGRTLTVALQDAFMQYDDTRLVIDKQPGAMVITQEAGRETLRTVWMLGAISLADLTGTYKSAYEGIYVFRHASRLWIQDISNRQSRILELSHQSLVELIAGFTITQD